MRVLALTKYGRQGASSRLRTLQYVDPLAARRIRMVPSPLFDDAYVARFNAGARRASDLPRYLARRIAALRGARGYDALWIEKELLPWMPWAIERRLLPAGLPIAVDYDDAIFHGYDRHRHAIVRRLLGRKIDRVMARADVVVAGNHYLAERARGAGARRVEWVPTVLDADRYPPRQRAPGATLRVGWIGSPSTAAYLHPLEPIARELRAARGIDFVAIGARPGQLDPAGFRTLPWREEEEAAAIAAFDIGLMPLPDSDWARGKCGYKLIQYMAAGVAAIASPIGANLEIVQDGREGRFADAPSEWRAAIEGLLADPALAARMGQAGRERVLARYSLAAQGPRLAEILRSLGR